MKKNDYIPETESSSQINLGKVMIIAFSLFCFVGSYSPVKTEAATLTYGVKTDAATNVGADGTCNMTQTVAPTARTTMVNPVTTAATSYRPTTGMVNGTPVILIKAYGPVYGSAQTITAPAGSFAIRGYNATDTWTFHVYDYNPAGAAGNKTLMYSSNTTVSGTGATVTVVPTYTLVTSAIAAGHRLMVEVVYTPGGTTYTPRIYLDGTTSAAWCQLTVTETAGGGPTGTLQFSLSNYPVSEAVGTATITVTRTGGSSGAASVNYATSNGTAVQPGDYTSASGTLNWADGDAADKTFTVTIINDVTVEASETVNLTLSGATGAAMGTPSAATITITDNDGAAAVPVGNWPLFIVVIGGMITYSVIWRRKQGRTNFQ